MTIDTLQDLLHKQPFSPFVVKLSNGDQHEVRHPEFAFVTKSNLVVGYPEADRIAICAVLHIASVETTQSIGSN